MLGNCAYIYIDRHTHIYFGQKNYGRKHEKMVASDGAPLQFGCVMVLSSSFSPACFAEWWSRQALISKAGTLMQFSVS